jgi:S1-C subfamily serine protease
VTQVAPGGPAARAGIVEGDVLVSARGQRLRTFLDWEAVLLDTGPGDTLTVAYRRAGQARTARLVVTDLPTSLAEKVSVLGGMKVVTVTPAVRVERNIRSDRGALIYDISAEMEQGTGLRSGDVIVQINRTRIESVDDLRRVFAAAAGGGAVTGVVRARRKARQDRVLCEVAAAVAWTGGPADWRSGGPKAIVTAQPNPLRRRRARYDPEGQLLLHGRA